MVKKTKRVSLKERAKMRKDPRFKKIYLKCAKKCGNEAQVFSIAYRQYLEYLFKTKKCADKAKKTRKASSDSREHKCLLKFEKSTLVPATEKYVKCIEEKVDPCVYKAFGKKSKKTLKRTLKKKTKKTLRKKGGFFGIFKKKEKVSKEKREKVIQDVLNVLHGKKSENESVPEDDPDDPLSGVHSPEELDRARRHLTTVNAAEVEWEAQLAAVEGNRESMKAEDILRNKIEKILEEDYHNEQFKNKKIYTSVILPDIINKVISYKSELETPSTSNEKFVLNEKHF
mgnify:FL=1|uniref:Uncharacterized protein n=1 Tax=viral metagenome TaxID=1070528 RepID=A0A6C0AVT4_9ZZZZ|tara:strand:+ start:874 stop:1728 length:855 start_codon:yes stop_codon:yes gene_type:complete